MKSYNYVIQLSDKTFVSESGRGSRNVCSARIWAHKNDAQRYITFREEKMGGAKIKTVLIQTIKTVTLLR